jgi:probable phosphoglycerate mutase
MVKIYLIRHGQTMFNVENKIAGQIETDLTELGKKQALELGQKLRSDNIKFDAIISSTLRRAKDTAMIISKEINAPVFYDANLVEFSNGIYEGVVVDELKKMQFNPPYKTAGFEFSNGADLYNAYSSFDDCYNLLSYPNGETKIEARDRFMKAIEKYLIENPNVENLGVVAHGAVIRFMLLKICPDLLKEKIKNAEARVVFYDKKQRIFKVNYN